LSRNPGFRDIFYFFCLSILDSKAFFIFFIPSSRMPGSFFCHGNIRK
jgi:hypothetical protein